MGIEIRAAQGSNMNYLRVFRLARASIYAIGAIAGLYAYFLIDSATGGQSPFLSFVAGICTALAFMALFFVGWILLRKRFGRSLIEALESACDPAECLKRAWAVEVGLKPPYDEFEAGIIARKGIALHEVGESDHARNILFLLKDSALKGKDAQGQSVSCLWAWVLAEALGETSRAEAYRSWLAGYALRVKNKGLQKALIQQLIDVLNIKAPG